MGHTEYTDDETYKLIHGTYPVRDDVVVVVDESNDNDDAKASK